MVRMMPESTMCNSTSKSMKCKKVDNAPEGKRKVLFGRPRRAKDGHSFPTDESEKTAPMSMESAELSLRGSRWTPGLKTCLKVKTQTESLKTKGACSSGSNEDVKTIRFSSLEVRDYPLTLGDNPSISSGPPLSITWAYENTRSFEVDVYEESRPARRGREQLHVPRHIREEWLRDEGYTRGEMKEAEERALKIKKSRQSNAKGSPLRFGKGKGAIQGKFKRWLGKASSDDDLYKKWKGQVTSGSPLGQTVTCSP